MSVPLENLAVRHHERTATVDPQRALAYAAATNDDNPAYRAGGLAPPVFGVVPAWDALQAVVTDLVPPELLPNILHSEHDMWFHRPLVPGATLVTRAEPLALRTSRIGTRLTVRTQTATSDAPGSAVLEQYATLFVRGMTGGDDAGPDKPSHVLGREARRSPLAEATIHVDADQTYRYRDASGDTNPIHVDEEWARRVGLPGIVVHGLCTMAMCGRVVVDSIGDGDPSRLKRLAVRFSKPVFPGDDLAASLFDGGQAGGRRTVTFEVRGRQGLVVKDGLAEVG